MYLVWFCVIVFLIVLAAWLAKICDIWPDVEIFMTGENVLYRKDRDAIVTERQRLANLSSPFDTAVERSFHS